MGALDAEHDALPTVRIAVQAADPTAPCLCLIDSAQHPLDWGDALEGVACSVAVIALSNWDNALTPWPAPPLYRSSAPFGGQAAQTLAQLEAAVLPTAFARHGMQPRQLAIAGYSLGGLFALFAFACSPAFAAVASMSGSLWYPGWTDWLAERLGAAGAPGLDGRFAFLSLGLKEKHAKEAPLKQVEARTEETATLLLQAGCAVRYITTPGGHFHHVPQRLAAGLAALDGFLA